MDALDLELANQRRRKNS